MTLLRRKGVAIVQTNKGVLVVAGRSKRYILPGGGANMGESRLKATIRELYEETGLKTKKIEYLFSYVGKPWRTHNGRMIKNDVKAFVVEAKGIPKPRNEIKYVDYWKPGSKLNLTSSTKWAIEKYINIKNK